ncbi:MAG: hypothetical protein ACREA0_01515 [bacterium]
MARERGEEKWAALCISKALDVEVEVHDDGSAPGMHDLDILYADRAPAAVEVTAAADPQLIELWKLVNEGGRWVVPEIAGGWMVVLDPAARAGLLRAGLPKLLRSLEEGIREVRAEEWWHPGPRDEEARALGILHVFQGGTDFPGSVYLTVDPGSERSGGAVPTTGWPLLEWLSAWLTRPDQAHNLAKLAASGAEERHLFLILPAFAEAPFAVADLLMRQDAPLPDADPDLPPEITHAWVASTWTDGAGMRWAPDSGWQRFAKMTRG